MKQEETLGYKVACTAAFIAMILMIVYGLPAVYDAIYQPDVYLSRPVNIDHALKSGGLVLEDR